MATCSSTRGPAARHTAHTYPDVRALTEVTPQMARVGASIGVVLHSSGVLQLLSRLPSGKIKSITICPTFNDIDGRPRCATSIQASAAALDRSSLQPLLSAPVVPVLLPRTTGAGSNCRSKRPGRSCRSQHLAHSTQVAQPAPPPLKSSDPVLDAKQGCTREQDAIPRSIYNTHEGTYNCSTHTIIEQAYL